jgi:hypothetical protein
MNVFVNKCVFLYFGINILEYLDKNISMLTCFSLQFVVHTFYQRDLFQYFNTIFIFSKMSSDRMIYTENIVMNLF